MRKIQPITDEDRERMKLHDRVLPDPITDGIIIRRLEDGMVVTNIPHVAIQGSPDGYEIGFGGSGPSDLAMNIVAAVFREEGWKGGRDVAAYRGSVPELVWALYQDFKWAFVANAPKAGIVIPYEMARDWLREKRDEELARQPWILEEPEDYIEEDAE